MSNVYKVAILTTHPIQYYAPLFKELSSRSEIDLIVYYCHRQTDKNQSDAGFGVEFQWDIELLEGYKYKFLKNISKKPDAGSFFGCDTPEISKIIKNEKFDAVFVFGWYTKSFWQAIFACWITRTKIFVRGDSQLDNSIKKYLKYPVYRLFIPGFSGCLYVGKRSKEYFEYYGTKKENLFFSPHSVDNKYFSNKSLKSLDDKKVLRRKLNINKNAFLVIFAGKFIEKKHPMHYVLAIEKASKKNNRICGIMVGDGVLKDKINSYINQNKLPIVLTGFINQKKIPEYYSISDLLVLPSDFGETWGLVVNEAMASGIPAVVSNRVGCSADLVKDNYSGFVYEYENIDDLAYIIKMISSDENLSNNLKANSQILINQYSIESSVEGFIKAIKV